DFNGDGVRELGEFGIQSVVVRLTGVDNQGHTVTIDATTDANGFYSFTGLQAGSYTIERPQPSGYTSGQSSAGMVDGSTDGFVDSGGNITDIVLGTGDEGTEYDFAELFAGS